MKVLLIQPSQRLVLGKKKRFGSIMPPLGLLSLVACIRKDCNVSTIDFYDYEINNGEPEPKFCEYDLIGLSGTSVHIPHVSALIETIRTNNQHACIFVGGPHATFAYDSLLEDNPGLDVVICGEGELSTTYLINHYSDRFNLPKFPGIITRSTEEFQLSPIVHDLDTLPGYAYDVIDIEKYQLSTHRQGLPSPFISYMASRGCPFSCKYCQTPKMFGNMIRYKSPELVYQECKKIKADFNYRSIVFWDDTFTSKRDYVIELCGFMTLLDIKWMCNTRVELVDLELLKIMKSSGCEIIFFGVESFQEHTLKSLNRTTNEESVYRAFELCKTAGIETVAALMVGAPNDNLERIDDNADKLIKLRPDNIYISIYNATVGSAEYEIAQKSGAIPERINWKNPNQFNGPPYGLPTICTNLNRFQLQKAQRHIYSEFYGKESEGQYE